MDAYNALNRRVPEDVRKVMLGMVTAPGKDLLPWDCDGRAHPGKPCSGELGCRVARLDADRWNLVASRKWRQLHAYVSQRVKRELGVRPRLLIRAWEPQWRGVNHVHPVVGYSSPGERRAARRYFELLSQAAPLYGFGPVSGVNPEVIPAERAAAYVISYCLNTRDPVAKYKRTVAEWLTDQAYVIPDRVFWVPPGLMGLSGVSMRSCKGKRGAWCALRAGEAYKHGRFICRGTSEGRRKANELMHVPVFALSSLGP